MKLFQIKFKKKSGEAVVLRDGFWRYQILLVKLFDLTVSLFTIPSIILRLLLLIFGHALANLQEIFLNFSLMLLSMVFGSLNQCVLKGLFGGDVLVLFGECLADIEKEVGIVDTKPDGLLQRLEGAVDSAVVFEHGESDVAPNIWVCSVKDVCFLEDLFGIGVFLEIEA